MKKIIIAAGVLALAGCSYVLPQSSQTLHDAEAGAGHDRGKIQRR